MQFVYQASLEDWFWSSIFISSFPLLFLYFRNYSLAYSVSYKEWLQVLPTEKANNVGYLPAYLCKYYFFLPKQILIQSMEALAAHLKRRNDKILEQELSLPKIPQIVSNQFTKTSIRMKKIKPVIKYVSQTTFSPEQQHIHDQIKFILRKQQTPILNENSRILELLKGREPIRQKGLLPKIRDTQGNKNRDNTSRVINPNLSTPRKSKSVSTKINLDSIFRDRDQFIESYFAQINAKMKR